MGTFAQQLIEKGRQQYLQQSIKEGMLKMLIHIFKCKFQTLPNDLLQRLEALDKETLMLWGERLIMAKTMEEVINI